MLILSEENKKTNTKEKNFNIKNMNKKQKSIICIGIIIIICLTGWAIAYNQFGIGMSDETKGKKIKELISTKDYDKAKKKTNQFFNDNDEEEKTLKKVLLNIIDLCEISGSSSVEEFSKKYNDLKDSVNALTISRISTEEKSFTHQIDKKYINKVNITVKNTGSKDIVYTKVNIYYKDKDGKIIGSDWTNDNSIIKPNAQQTLSKYAPSGIYPDKVEAEIDTFRTK